jgi:hypothetical protein
MSEYADKGTKFSDMSIGRKFTWTLKFMVALVTFGFAFPNIMHE